jgi:predicted GTPase
MRQIYPDLWLTEPEQPAPDELPVAAAAHQTPPAAIVRKVCRVEAVAVGTPIDLSGLVAIPVPHTRVRYELQVIGRPTLEDVLEGFGE